MTLQQRITLFLYGTVIIAIATFGIHDFWTGLSIWLIGALIVSIAYFKT